MNTLRCFIAIDLSADVRHALESLVGGLRPQVPDGGIRWVRPSGIHLTLKFLGEVRADRVPELKRVLDNAAPQVAPFVMALTGLGCFPDVKRPRVVWVGIEDPDGRISRLQKLVEAGCVASGWEAEDRPFSPHLTLGRVTRQAGPDTAQALRKLVEAGAAPIDSSMTVDAVHLFRSELGPGGAVYTRLHSATLAGAG